MFIITLMQTIKITLQKIILLILYRLEYYYF